MALSTFRIIGTAVLVVGLSSCSGDGGTEAQSGPIHSASAPSDEPTADRCDAVPPTSLPSGATPGEADRGQEGFAWGTGLDRVVQQVGNPLNIRKNWRQRVAFRGGEAMLVPIGDPGQIAFVFTMNRCTYTTWIGPGLTMGEAETYISTY